MLAGPDDNFSVREGVGRRVQWPRDDPTWFNVVGVARGLGRMIRVKPSRLDAAGGLL